MGDEAGDREGEAVEAGAGDRVAIERAELEALRGESERLARELATAEARAAERERRLREAVRERDLSGALAGRALQPGAAEQLVRLWREEFDVVDGSDGRPRAVARDGRPAAEAIGEWLGRAEYAHFCQATTRGGVARPATAASASGVASGPVPGLAPATLGEEIVRVWREAQRESAGSGGPAGLRPRR